MNNGENQTNEQALSPERQDFLNNLQSTNGSYLTTVIISASVVAVGLVLAAFLNIFAGLAVCIAATLYYMLATKLILDKKLGISYRSTSGELSVVSLKARDKQELFIPSRLLWLDVAEIEAHAFKNGGAQSLHTIHLPATLKSIGDGFLDGCDALRTICFEGSREEWEAIEKNTSFDGLEIIFFDDAPYSLPKKVKVKKAHTESTPKDEITEDESTKEKDK